MKLQDIPAFIITVKGHKVSEAYCNYVLPFWQKFGIRPSVNSAITPDTLPQYLEFAPVLSVKYQKLGIRKDHTPTEQAIWYSHCELWRKCIQIDQPILVLEHDVIPVDVSRLIPAENVDYHVFDRGAMGCYMITPKFASWMLDFLTRRWGVVDTGPGSMIDWVSKDWKKELSESGIDIVVHSDRRYHPCCTQVIDRRYGTVIDHYTGTEAEGHEWHEFEHYKEISLPL